MKTIILISGASSSGKTSSIRSANEQLPQSSRILLNKIFKREIRVVKEVNSVLLGIVSAGDTLAIVTKNIQLFEKYKCEVAIMASKSYGSTIQYVSDYCALNNIKLVSISRVRLNTCDISEIKQSHIQFGAIICQRFYDIAKSIRP